MPGDPPCFSHTLIGGHPVDPETARDVTRWRKGERARLVDLRRQLRTDDRTTQDERIAEGLDRLIGPEAAVIGGYWPIRGEPDLRGWMKARHEAGARLALPVVVEKDAPLIYREWWPRCRMERGVWGILVPAEGEALHPDVVLAPVVGLDKAGYRLGNGGGYFDRTLVALEPAPRAIAVGHDFTRIGTIFPQPWDIAMDAAALGDGDLEIFGPG